MSKECPVCATAVVPIVYGRPGPGLRVRAGAGEVRLGGCVVRPDRPQWWCADCRLELRAEDDGRWTRVGAALGILGKPGAPERFVIGHDSADCPVAVPADWEFVAPVHAVLERIGPVRWRISRPAAEADHGRPESYGATLLRRGSVSRPLEPGESAVIDDRVTGVLTVSDAAGTRRLDVGWTVFR